VDRIYVWLEMVVAFKSASYDPPAFLSHWSRLIVFYKLVGCVSRVNIASSTSGYSSSANSIESLDCFNCGSVLMACSNCLICLAFSSAMLIYGALRK
jgi:hypothetical protein